jgi:hypothetical protein
VRTKKGSHIGRRSYKYKTKNVQKMRLSSRHHQFAGLMANQVVNMLIMNRQRTINSINLAIATGGRNNIRAEETDFSLG